MDTIVATGTNRDLSTAVVAAGDQPLATQGEAAAGVVLDVRVGGQQDALVNPSTWVR